MTYHTQEELVGASDYIKAIEMAAIAHKDVKRKFSDEPYFVHPLRVSKTILESTGSYELASAAVLHDTLEDTDLRAEAIFSEFSGRVLTLVESVTKNQKLPKAEREAEYLKRFSTAPLETVLIKLADRLDNVQDLNQHEVPSHFRESYIKNTVALLSSIPDNLNGDARVEKLKAEIIQNLSRAREDASRR